MITGEVGAGKTVAIRAALAGLDHPRHTVIYLPNPAVGVTGIHHAVVTSLGGVPRPHKSTLIPQAADALATEHAERGRIPVLIIDEAHLLDHEQLEAVRMLINLDMDLLTELSEVSGQFRGRCWAGPATVPIPTRQRAPLAGRYAGFT